MTAAPRLTTADPTVECDGWPVASTRPLGTIFMAEAVRRLKADCEPSVSDGAIRARLLRMLKRANEGVIVGGRLCV
ncbi:MAG: hypothetical protein V3T70_05720, partial [Phycisphaerae bacterium]